MSELRSMSDERLARPHVVNGLDLAFGGKIGELMPSYKELPEEFRQERDPFSKLVSKWFFEGIKKDDLTPKPGIDANVAWNHLWAIMASFEPSHEHKTAGVAYLMSRWFEPPQQETVA